MGIIVEEVEVLNNFNYDEMPPLIPIYYTPDGIDCTFLIHEFVTHELSFYNTILSYSNVLNLKINGVIVSSASLYFGITEYNRNNLFVNFHHSTIHNWINTYCGSIKDIKYVFDNVYMGDTSLWAIIQPL
jgi:hypothetical protein